MTLFLFSFFCLYPTEAGSTSLVNQLTNSTTGQSTNREAQMLCEGRIDTPHQNVRIAMVRNPAARLKSAVEEVQRLHHRRLARWSKKLGSHPTYARIDAGPQARTSIPRFDAFLDDYFRGRLAN